MCPADKMAPQASCGLTDCREPGILAQRVIYPAGELVQVLRHVGRTEKKRRTLYLSVLHTLLVQYPRGDSNARHRLRRPVLYPLSYGGKAAPSVS